MDLTLAEVKDVFPRLLRSVISLLMVKLCEKFMGLTPQFLAGVVPLGL